jgi:hypothetical protein
MGRHAHTRVGADHASWEWTQWIAPPEADEVRKLFNALGRIEDASPYLTRVKRYVVDGPLRGELGISIYDETIWGSIRWRRALGTPSTSHRADGFQIVHEYEFSYDAGPGSDGEPRTKEKWLPGNQAEVWDGPDDEETLAVSFMIRGLTQWDNRVSVGLPSPFDWAPPDDPWLTLRRRTIDSPPEASRLNVGKAPVDLGIFEVVRTW